MTKTWGWFAALFGIVAVWRGRAWVKERANRRIKVDAVSEHWIAQQRGRAPLT